MQPPRALFVVGRFSSEASGIERAVSELAHGLAQRGAPIALYTADCEPGRSAGHLVRPPNRFQGPPGRWLGGLSYSPALRRLLQATVADFDVVHNHTVWMLPNHYASAAARRLGKPVLFTPHGTLEPWAVRRSAWKKRLVAAWFQDRDFRRAACFHALSNSEVAGIRAYGLRNPVAVIPNGVWLDELDQPADANALLARWPELAGKRLCLFLSRLHQKKGLAHLLLAWSQLVPRHPDWRLVIAGPDYGYGAVVARQIGELGLGDSVVLTGPLYGEEKRAALAAAAVFVLPSFSEGFSMAILEAMAAGLPVLLTPGCNFPEVAAAAAGIETQPTVDGTREALQALMQASATERAEMGRRGRALVANHYQWGEIAGKMLSLYEWLAGGGAPPAFVHSD